MFARLCLFIAAISPFPLAAHPMDETFTWGNQSVAFNSSVDPVYDAIQSDFTLTESRYPFVVYATRYPHTLRGVKWRDGRKLDEVLLAAPGEILEVKLQSTGKEVAMVHEVRLGEYHFELRYSRLSATGWSAPEVVYTSGKGILFDLELAPDGSPVMAINHPESSGSPTRDELRYYERTSSGWTYQVVRPLSYNSVTLLDLAIMPDGQPQVGYQEYRTNASPSSRAIHASRTNGVWASLPIFDGSFGAWACGADGILRVAGGGGYREFRNGAWTAAEQPGDPYGPYWRDSMTAARDGTVYLVSVNELRVRKDGVWSNFPIPVLKKVILDDAGIPHLLGDKGRLIRYHTRIPSSWEQMIVTPEGSADTKLKGLVTAGTDDPRVYANQSGSGTREFSYGNGSWQNNPVDHQINQVEYAMKPGGRLHALSSTSYWSGTASALTLAPIPVQVTSSSSEDIYSLFLDAAGNPHATFPFDHPDSPDYSIYYAVKRNGTWQAEAVAKVRYIHHSAVAVDSQGVPHVLTSDGFYKKSGNGWHQEFPLDAVKFTCLIASPDGNLHGLYKTGSSLFAFSGKDGNYVTEVLDENVFLIDRPSLALAAGRPVAAYVSTREYPRSYMLNYAEKTGNYWRQETVVPISKIQKYGDVVRIAADPSGQVYLAAPREYTVGSFIKNHLTLHKRKITLPAAADRPLLPSLVAGTTRGFRLPLPVSARPLQFQASPDLKTWNLLLDLSLLPALPAPSPSFEIRGDGFRNDVIFRAPANAPSQFVRLRDK